MKGKKTTHKKGHIYEKETQATHKKDTYEKKKKQHIKKSQVTKRVQLRWHMKH